jgi:hypothetical protein
VIARLESEPMPAGTWDALFDAVAAAAAELGVMIGGHIVDAGKGFEPADGAAPESWRPAQADTKSQLAAPLQGGTHGQPCAHAPELMVGVTIYGGDVTVCRVCSDAVNEYVLWPCPWTRADGMPELASEPADPLRLAADAPNGVASSALDPDLTHPTTARGGDRDE